MATILPIDIIAPGSWGLNTERKNQLLTPEWATAAQNAIIGRSGRMGARNGWANQTTNAISGTHTIDVLHEYLDENGTSTIICTANNAVYKDIDDFTDAANDITSSTTPTADHWQFINFNGKVLGFQRSHTPIEWAGSGDFTDAVYTGTGPDGNAAVAAFGRVWAADADLQTIRVSALLDDTDYSTGAGGGTIDMSSLWTKGMDEIVAIAAVGANLVVFGKNHIVMWGDGSGSQIGMSLANAHVVDTIEGTGCIARDSVQATGEGDLIFLSRHGLQSLGRVIQFKSNPITALTDNIRTDFLESIRVQRGSDAEMDQVRSFHSPEEGIYVINFPQQDKQYCFDTHHPFEDDDGNQFFPVTTWQVGGSISGMVSIVSGEVYFGSAGVVGKYSGQDDNGSTYDFQMKTGWLDLGEVNHRLKMLKEIRANVRVGIGTVNYTWNWDFDETDQSRSVSYNTANPAEFNVAEFNIDEFSGNAGLQRKNIPAYGEGQFLKLGVSATVNGFNVDIQQLSVAPQLGRMVV